MSTANWLGNIAAKVFGKVVENKSAVKPPAIVSLPLKTDQYFQTAHSKKYIFLHHTAGGSAASSVSHWASNKDRIATPYLIDRDGTIYECYDPKYWAYHLGAGIKSLEQESIGIEICSYGQLVPNMAGDLLTYTKRVIPKEKSAKMTFRGFDYWEAYTPEQISALGLLLPYLVDRFKITLQPDRKNFWEYQKPATLPPGIWSHTTVRKDKLDIFPQKELVDLVYKL